MTAEAEHHAQSFAPVIDVGAKLLILGSMPGQRSLQQQQYYAHPRNAFWPIMAELLGFDAELPYAERLARLQRHGIALWDVLAECRRPGSLDSSIVEQSIRPNDFAALLDLHPTIEAIFFNGAKAEQAFNRYVLKGLPDHLQQLPRQRLPSTSPAHAAMKLAQKSHCWRQQLDAILRIG
ncbi:DNA-deoxyinosine glycosylase [Motiliproteus coralliicola]|uniref:DNA-deoxyinosine glycosylase n=1 Tax=Motiliproteus coralliicola TaxID=2283196 RepID=UPI001FB23E84|nr:DNA-deoxyinosine glycosylase [Motiliproteus coralliicola]